MTRIWGYAALFGRVDRGGDVVRPGAFRDSLRRTGGRVPLLWQHEAGRAVGTVELLGEDARGLKLVASVGERRAAAAVRAGAVTGLSFGYRVRRGHGANPRVLDEVELVEVSLVRAPMQPGARVERVARID